MLSLVLTIFFVHIAIYLVNTIGATTIDTLVCSLESWFLADTIHPTPHGRLDQLTLSR